MKNLFLSIAVLAATTLPAQANQHLNCAAYASEAVAQANHANSLSCGFKGGRWSTNYQGHFNWCNKNTTTINQVTIESQKRKSGLSSCQTKVARCDGYASVAVESAKVNIQNKCGYTGGRWSTNYAGHKKWCMSASEASITKEEGIRSQHYSQCLIGNGQGLKN